MFSLADLLVALGLAAIPISLLIAFVSGHDNEERTRRTIKPLRLSTSWILVVCAWIIFFTSTALHLPALLIALGMTCGAFGAALQQRGIPVLGAHKGITRTQQVIADVHQFGGGLDMGRSWRGRTSYPCSHRWTLAPIAHTQ